MRDYIFKFMKENKISIFDKVQVRSSSGIIFKTKDAKEIHQKTVSKITDNFKFENTKHLLKIFDFTNSKEEIKKRQEFFSNLEDVTNESFSKIKKRFSSWRAPYESVVVTEEETTLIKLKEAGCSVIFVNQQSDLRDLDKYDLVRYIDCETFEGVLERMPHTISIIDLEDARLEYYLGKLSSWKETLEILKNGKNSRRINEIIHSLEPLLRIVDFKIEKSLDVEDLELILESINSKILEKIKLLTLTGESVVSLLVKGIPKEIKEVLEYEISSSRLPRELFLDTIPLKLDAEEVSRFIKKQTTNKFLDSFSLINRESGLIKKIPSILEELEKEIVYQDFVSGIIKFKRTSDSFPDFEEEFSIEKSKNLFLNNPQPISFYLNSEEKCSILTGANSGGKTTLLEHLIQLITLSQIGLPTSGTLITPLFEEIYYFAKNKGSISKGAFETLLTQMSEIKFGKKTLILADEIESVTEPGVAGEIVTSTAKYFIQNNCYLVIATHLGQEVQKSIPKGTRIDGIEARGLTEDYELIVDHNPVLGKLANSTPELIIEKMAKSKNNSYLTWLFNNLSKNKN